MQHRSPQSCCRMDTAWVGELCARTEFPQAMSASQEIAGMILKEQSPKRLYEVRGKLYELLVNCIPPELVLRRLALELLPKLDDELKHKAVEHAAFFEHRLQARRPRGCTHSAIRGQ